MTTTLAENQGKTAKSLTEDFARLTAQIDARIAEMREGNEAKLLEIQGIVDQKLQEGIEKRMTESFAKITTQFAEVQQAVGEVKNVAGQVGDLKRLFANVKSRGGWGEAQVKATLDDILPPGSYETNMRVNPATSDTVEFALRLPGQNAEPVYLAIDAKFPVEDYTRFLAAIEAADTVAEKAAKTALEAQIRMEARKIQTKYIAPPHTVEWAVLYLPSEGLYAEVTRNGDLMEAIHREHRVIIMGPSMLAVMGSVPECPSAAQVLVWSASMATAPPWSTISASERRSSPPTIRSTPARWPATSTRPLDCPASPPTSSPP